MTASPNHTRTRILEAARRLFHEQGFAATGISTILREAGVNSGSLYHFFPSKEAILAAVLDYYTELLEPQVMAPARRARADPIARVFRLLEWYREGLAASGCRMGCPIGNLALEVADSHPELRGRIDLNFEKWAAGVESWLVESGDRLPPDVDRRRLARFVLTVMEGAIMQARASADLAPFDASVEQLRLHFDLLQERARSLASRSRPRAARVPARLHSSGRSRKRKETSHG